MLPLEILTPETVLAFLHYLEQTRSNAIGTRNARLATLRSFVHYLVDWLGPELPACTRRILAIPFKRQVKRLIGFLTQAEIEALLAATDDDTWTGRRDHLLLLLLYNTGARISELIALRVQDLTGASTKQVQLQGKGRKHRTLPLWSQTQRVLRRWIRENRLSPGMPLLPNRHGDRSAMCEPGTLTATASPHFVAYTNSKSYGMKMPRLGTEDAVQAWISI